MALKDFILTPAERAERRREAALVEKEALRLYDKLNPRADEVVRVSKAECIRRARRALISRNIVQG